MKTFKFEQLKRRALPDFLRKAKTDILNARKKSKEDDINNYFQDPTQNNLEDNQEFAKYFEQKVTKSKGVGASNLERGAQGDPELDNTKFDKLPKRK